jgi:hypothetical protein
MMRVLKCWIEIAVRRLAAPLAAMIVLQRPGAEGIGP